MEIELELPPFETELSCERKKRVVMTSQEPPESMGFVRLCIDADPSAQQLIPEKIGTVVYIKLIDD